MKKHLLLSIALPSLAILGGCSQLDSTENSSKIEYYEPTNASDEKQENEIIPESNTSESSSVKTSEKITSTEENPIQINPEIAQQLTSSEFVKNIKIK